MKDEGLELIKEHEMSTMDDVRSTFLQKLESIKDPKTVQNLIKKHEEDTRRLKHYLDLEKNRQESELLNKLEQRRLKKKMEVRMQFKQEEDVLNAKHEGQKNRMQKDILMVQVDFSIPVYDNEDQPNRIREQVQKNEQFKKTVNEYKKETEIQVDMLKSKLSDELDAVDKEFQLSEQELQNSLTKKMEDYDVKIAKDLLSLKKRFQKELKSAPTSRERNEIVIQYEEAKAALTEALNNDRSRQEETLKKKLKERKKKKQHKELQLKGQYENNKVLKETELELEKANERAKFSLEVIEDMVKKGLENGEVTLQELPLYIEGLLTEKSDEATRLLAKQQFTETTKALTNLLSQVMILYPFLLSLIGYGRKTTCSKTNQRRFRSKIQRIG
jgi:hypothetical protein